MDNKQIPYDLLEFQACEKLINMIIVNTIDDMQLNSIEITEDMKSLIITCMVRYRKLLHDKLQNLIQNADGVTVI